VHRPPADWRRRVPERALYAVLAAGLLIAIVLEVAKHGGWWQLAAFGLGPDLALFAGAGSGLERGQLHPRAVPLYNALHRFRGPVILLAAAPVGLVGSGWFIGGLAWALHIAIDRALGFGLRTPDGFQRA
jgi:hypothetical protein